MSNRISAPDRLPSAPEEYSQDHMNRLIGLLDQHLEHLSSRKRIYGTTANFSDLPTSSTDLRVGDLWNDAGVVKVKT